MGKQSIHYNIKELLSFLHRNEKFYIYIFIHFIKDDNEMKPVTIMCPKLLYVSCKNTFQADSVHYSQKADIKKKHKKNSPNIRELMLFSLLFD